MSEVKRHDDTGMGFSEKAGFMVRNYIDYRAYLEKQAQKYDSRPGWCKERSRQLHIDLSRRLELYIDLKPHRSVLCLGARAGGEVQAFIGHGHFAIGIDLNPGASNMYVVSGDFHSLQFADDSVDVVYYNCFDHCIDPGKLLSEIRRVLKPDGRFILEVKAGTDETERKPMGSDHWDCLEWETIERLSAIIQEHGFAEIESYFDKKTKATPYGFIYKVV